MKRGFLIGFFLIALGSGLGSCKKCYNCKLSAQLPFYSVDSTVVLQQQVCSGKNGAGPDANAAVQELEANGYTCTQ